MKKGDTKPDTILIQFFSEMYHPPILYQPPPP